jgi:hypothetical protein
MLKPKGRERFLDRDELGKFLEACDASEHPFLGAMVRLAVNTGMRRAELMMLRWSRSPWPNAALSAAHKLAAVEALDGLTTPMKAKPMASKLAKTEKSAQEVVDNTEESAVSR